MAEKISYDSSYDNNQSSSPVYRKHMENVADHIEETAGSVNKKTVLEVGCGNGYLLSLLKNKKAIIKGFDPAYNGLFDVDEYVERRYFTTDNNTQKYDLIIMRLTIEGLHDVNSIMNSIEASANDDSYLYIEMLDLVEILDSQGVVNIYHEYARYYSVNSISLLLTKFNYSICSVQTYEGNVVGIVAKRLNINKCKPSVRFLDEGTTAIWGVGGRSVNFLTNNDLGTGKIEFAIDIDPSKQGRYIPVTGQLIVSPKEAQFRHPDNVIILNRIYVSEISSFFDYDVTIYTIDDIYK